MRIIANSETPATVYTHTHTGNLVDKCTAKVESKLEKENTKKVNNKYKIRLNLSCYIWGVISLVFAFSILTKKWKEKNKKWIANKKLTSKMPN